MFLKRRNKWSDLVSIVGEEEEEEQSVNQCNGKYRVTPLFTLVVRTSYYLQ